MGISSSTVTAGIKDQVEGQSNALYQLADVKGTGKLALSAKKALKYNDNKELDEMIKTVKSLFFLKKSLKLIKPFLYNNGAGEMLPIEQVILIRHKERTGIFFIFL